MPQDEQDDAWVGRRIGGRYEIVRPLAAGGQGTVFVARHVESGVDLGLVALKLWRRDDEDSRAILEAQSARAVRNPHVVKVFDVGVDHGHPFVVMELVEGMTLRAVLDAGPLPRAQIRRIAGQLVEALSALHAAGLVHRDLKPSNVMIHGEHVTLLDLGIAIGAHAAAEAAVRGSNRYIAPEHRAGEAIDARADVYALGVVLDELGAGREGLGPLVSAMRAELPEERPTMRSVAAQLESTEAAPRGTDDDVTVTASPPRATTSPKTPAAPAAEERAHARPALAVAAVVLVAVLAAFAAMRGTSTHQATAPATPPDADRSARETSAPSSTHEPTVSPPASSTTEIAPATPPPSTPRARPRVDPWRPVLDAPQGAQP